MRIAIFTNNYLPNPYGVTGSVESFRKEFEKNGHAVYIFAPSFEGYKDENPHVFRYPSVNFKLKIKFPLAISYSRKINKIIKKLNLDIIHSQHPNLLGTAAMKWAQKKKIPLVFTWHTLYDHYVHFASIIPKNIALNYIIKKAVKYADRADAVVVPTDSIIPILRQWGVKNKNIIPVATGVEEEMFNNSDRNLIRGKFSIKNDEILLLLISRLTSEKNVEFVLRSLLLLLKKITNVKLLISGGGDLREKLKKISQKENIADKVIITNVVSREKLKNYYAAGDIFVYGSKSETQGMVVSEAMYMGLPIVAVNATGIKSIVLNNGNGFLVKEDKKEFFEAVQKLINDKNLRQKFGETSKRIAQTQFTSKICAEKMLEVYEKTIENFE